MLPKANNELYFANIYIAEGIAHQLSLRPVQKWIKHTQAATSSLHSTVSKQTVCLNTITITECHRKSGPIFIQAQMELIKFDKIYKVFQFGERI